MIKRKPCLLFHRWDIRWSFTIHANTSKPTETTITNYRMYYLCEKCGITKQIGDQTMKKIIATPKAHFKLPKTNVIDKVKGKLFDWLIAKRAGDGFDEYHNARETAHYGRIIE